jgi:hypothetical protein
VRELPDDAVLSNGLCKFDAAGAVQATCEKCSGTRIGSPRTRWRYPYSRSVVSTSRSYHQVQQPALLKRPRELDDALILKAPLLGRAFNGVVQQAPLHAI